MALIGLKGLTHSDLTFCCNVSPVALNVIYDSGDVIMMTMIAMLLMLMVVVKRIIITVTKMIKLIEDER